VTDWTDSIWCLMVIFCMTVKSFGFHISNAYKVAMYDFCIIYVAYNVPMPMYDFSIIYVAL
jgi:hypothetical protein